jgi:uncharacterized membrane protein YedE/YeeE
MTLPLTGDVALKLAVPFGMLFGWLLHRGGVADSNVIVNQFRLRDHTVLKIMLTAILVGGVGVWALHGTGHATYQIKPANLLGVALGAMLFGVGMVLYGFCPGTGVAAIATGSVDALVGFFGMLGGAILYALSYPWVEKHIQTVAALGKVRLPELTGVPDAVWFAALAGIAGVVFWWLEKASNRSVQSES